MLEPDFSPEYFYMPIKSMRNKVIQDPQEKNLWYICKKRNCDILVHFFSILLINPPRFESISGGESSYNFCPVKSHPDLFFKSLILRVLHLRAHLWNVSIIIAVEKFEAQAAPTDITATGSRLTFPANIYIFSLIYFCYFPEYFLHVRPKLHHGPVACLRRAHLKHLNKLGRAFAGMFPQLRTLGDRK